MNHQLARLSDFVSKKTLASGPNDILELFEINGKIYAVKRRFLSKNSINKEKKGEFIEALKMEYEKIMGNELPNVIKIYGYYYDEKKEELLISMEPYDENLEVFVQKQGKLSFDAIISLLRGILKGKTLNIKDLNIYILFTYK